MVDAMPGATDDEKLAAAIERAGAMRDAPSAPPTLVDLLLGPRAYTFRQPLPGLPAGVRIVGRDVAVQLTDAAWSPPIDMRDWRLSNAYIGGPDTTWAGIVTHAAHEVTHHSTRLRWRMTCSCGWYLDPAPRLTTQRTVIERAHQRSGT